MRRERAEAVHQGMRRHARFHTRGEAEWRGERARARGGAEEASPARMLCARMTAGVRESVRCASLERRRAHAFGRFARASPRIPDTAAAFGDGAVVLVVPSCPQQRSGDRTAGEEAESGGRSVPLACVAW